ncbi:sulfotransferase family protein [Cribrihabitans neustonicus]|uniref:sulfotransferase family protein n=1 Tax=Cribrihabitans neustonicus TaxID=1429085 RepID=UPI003B5CABAF
MFGLKTAVFCGPMKSGTTWVHAYLQARGDVCLPARTKEIFYFDRYYTRGPAWYEGQFRPQPQHRMLVDVAPSILAQPHAPVRVAETLPEARVIILRRDPVARAWSHYLHLKRYGYTAAPLAEAIEAHPAIIEASQVERWLARWRAALGEDRVSLLDASLLSRDAQAFARAVDALLGLPESPVDASRIGRINGAAVPRHYLISKLARKISYGLRDIGLDGLVQAARDRGWNRIYARRSGAAPPPAASEADKDLIRSKLMEAREPV